MEIQVIQRVNLELKKIEHKLYDFSRAETHFLEKVEENEETLSSLREMNSKFSRASAENVSHSELSNLETVTEVLKP